MTFDQLFAAIEGGERLVRLARGEVYRQQQECPHEVMADIVQDPDEPTRERCVRCRHERLKR